MHPIGTPQPLVTVEYDAANGRRTKTFDCPWKGKSFYVAKDRAGKNPSVMKGTQAMSTSTKSAKKSPTKKTPAKEKPAAKAPAAKEKPAKPTADRDAFGCRTGSQSAAINALLSASKPKKVETIAEEAGLNPSRVRSHLKFLLSKRLVQETKLDDALAYATIKVKPSSKAETA